MPRKLALVSAAFIAAQIQCAQPQGLEHVVGQPNYAAQRQCSYNSKEGQLLDEIKKLVSKGNFADEGRNRYYVFMVGEQDQSAITAAFVYNGIRFPDSQLERIIPFRNGKTMVMERSIIQKHYSDKKFSCIFEDFGDYATEVKKAYGEYISSQEQKRKKEGERGDIILARDLLETKTNGIPSAKNFLDGLVKASEGADKRYLWVGSKIFCELYVKDNSAVAALLYDLTGNEEAFLHAAFYITEGGKNKISKVIGAEFKAFIFPYGNGWNNPEIVDSTLADVDGQLSAFIKTLYNIYQGQRIPVKPLPTKPKIKM